MRNAEAVARRAWLLSEREFMNSNSIKIKGWIQNESSLFLCGTGPGQFFYEFEQSLSRNTNQRLCDA
jgi:hypothetical protein